MSPEPRDPDTIIDECLILRASHPETPIVIVSSKIGLNDFSMTRSSICDASLRLPVSQSAFKLGIPAAIENNIAYRRRIADQKGQDLRSPPQLKEPLAKGWDWPLCAFGIGATISILIWAWFASTARLL